MANIPADVQQPKSGQLSGKYYRTRSLSQNLQQIFHPHRQSHSRSINNLSVVGATGATKNAISNALKVPQSLPQSPRILLDSGTSPFFAPLQIHPLNFSPPVQSFTNPAFPMFHFALKQPKVLESSAKLKGFNLGEYRRSQYSRWPSTEKPPLPKPLEKRLSWEERRKPGKFQINDAVKENKELLRKYSDPKLQILEPGSSLTHLQSAFKAKLASLFKNKKKYTIAEPSSRSGKENDGNYVMHRCDSCHSLPTLNTGQKKRKEPKNEKKDRKALKQMKKSSIERCQAYGKLKSLNLNPPHMIGGSFDNLLLINRMNQKRPMHGMGTYDTYHGKPLLSYASRLKALYKYRKPSESDDATTLSFDYDSGDMSDTSSLERSSSEVGEDSSSFSDLTTKSSSYAYKIGSSASVHSMPQFKSSHKLRKSVTAVQSPNRSLELPQFPTKFKSIDSGNRSAQQPHFSTFPKTVPYHLTHQMSAPALNNRSDYPMMMPMMQQQPSFGQFTKPNLYPSLSMTTGSVHVNQNPNQMIKAFFTSGPASSNECPLVSFSLCQYQIGLVKSLFTLSLPLNLTIITIHHGHNDF